MISTSIILSSTPFIEKLINYFPMQIYIPIPSVCKVASGAISGQLVRKYSKYHHKLPESKMLHGVKGCFLHPKCVKLLVAQFQPSLCASVTNIITNYLNTKWCRMIEGVFNVLLRCRMLEGVFNVFLHLSDYIIQKCCRTYDKLIGWDNKLTTKSKWWQK